MLVSHEIVADDGGRPYSACITNAVVNDGNGKSERNTLLGHEQNSECRMEVTKTIHCSLLHPYMEEDHLMLQLKTIGMVCCVQQMSVDRYYWRSSN